MIEGKGASRLPHTNVTGLVNWRIASTERMVNDSFNVAVHAAACRRAAGSVANAPRIARRLSASTGRRVACPRETRWPNLLVRARNAPRPARGATPAQLGQRRKASWSKVFVTITIGQNQPHDPRIMDCGVTEGCQDQATPGPVAYAPCANTTGLPSPVSMMEIGKPATVHHREVGRRPVIGIA